MKTYTKSTAFLKILFAVMISPILITSCKKEDITSPSTNSVSSSNSDDITGAENPGIYKLASGNIKLVLRPGPTDGADAWVQWYEYDPAYADANTATSFEIKPQSWTINGGVINLREFIKFTGLSQVPDTSRIVSAKLFLYGLDPNDPLFPQGNSYYPGSPYNQFGDNGCYVERVVEDWDENTITWNNQPLINQKNRTEISPSTSQWNYNTVVDVTQLVKPMIKNSKNYGLRISMKSETPYHSVGFYSSDATDAKKRPKLVVTYQ